jgi:hypothetical protein
MPCQQRLKAFPGLSSFFQTHKQRLRSMGGTEGHPKCIGKYPDPQRAEPKPGGRLKAWPH